MKRITAILAMFVAIFAMYSFELLPRNIYGFAAKDIIGYDTPLSHYKGKVILIVNVASQCAFTPQYQDLQALYEKYEEQGLVVLGFPSNDFSQEPATNEEVRHFCTQKYAITFPMFSKVSVTGDDAHPLFRYLTRKSENGIFDVDLSWNFHKFLIDRNGKVVANFKPKARVTDKKITAQIEALLQQK